MKLTTITSAALALALATVMATSARAQNVTYTPGDLLIGFDQTGAANDYVVDLGGINQFIDAASGATLTFDLSTSDLVNAFGSSWASNSQTNLVQWGAVAGGSRTGSQLVGDDTLAKNTLFLTIGELTPGTQSSTPNAISSGNATTINGNLTANFASGSGGFAGTTPTSGSTDSIQAIDQTHGATNSWSYEISTKTDFGYGSNIQQPLSGLGAGPTDSVLDLYEFVPGATPDYLGDLSLNSSGVLTFTAAAPEPDTYALIALSLTFLVWHLRRKGLPTS